MVNFKEDERLSTLNHSCAHVMAQAVKHLYPHAKFWVGPVVKEGFYYDIDLGNDVVNDEVIAAIEKEMKKICKEGKKIYRREVSKAEAMEMFKDDMYKLDLISNLEDGNITVYDQGDFTDLCRGPHVDNTKLCKNFKLVKHSGVYWKGDASNHVMQRIYGVCFPTAEELEAHLKELEEAKERDHRKIGKEMELFMTDDLVGRGLPMFLPKGYTVWQELENYIKDKERRLGYLHVMTPCVGTVNLYKTSGHWDHYKENMFFVQKDEDSDEQFVVKPMNCPFHILIYQANRYSYRSLPLRMAELGTVYRKEKSGALAGLTRVQGFTQDDAHIFCTPEQLVDEINAIIDFVADTMAIFKMSFEVELSTRPESFVGEIENWNKAEAGLKEAMDRRGMKYEINEGDGAFYGPKIDFKVKDAIGRTWQCATIQLDFNLPARFDIKYQDKDGSMKTPIMLHRVIFGSMERFHGILIEHYAGAFPTWLAPTQVSIVPISNEKHADFAEQVYKKMRAAGIRVKLDDRSESMNYKIRESLQDKKIPYVCVIGDKEIEAGAVAVRKRGVGQVGTKSVDEFISEIEQEIKDRI